MKTWINDGWMTPTLIAFGGVALCVVLIAVTFRDVSTQFQKQPTAAPVVDALGNKTTIIAKWEQDGYRCAVREVQAGSGRSVLTTTCTGGGGVSAAMSNMEYDTK